MGETLHGRYLLQRRLGSGGMGEVWLAQDSNLGLPVAIKRLDIDAVSPQERQEQIDAFREEAQLLARLHHAQLPRVSNYFAEGPGWYLVMDYIEGETLEARMARTGVLTSMEAARLGIQLCDILAYLHGQQPAVIFRDLKPANVLARSDGSLVLVDFGIARRFKPGQAKDTRAYGTMGYAPPEQFNRAQTDQRSDIYSLGVFLYALVTGDDPAQTPFTLPLQHVSSNELRQILARMVQHDPALRPASVGVVRAALETLLRTVPTPSQPVPSVAPALAPVSLVGSGQPAKGVFLVYAKNQAKLIEQIIEALSLYRRKYGLTFFHNEKAIHPGERKQQGVERMVRESCVILPVLSPAFLGDDDLYEGWCGSVLPTALSSGTRMIPILAQPMSLEGIPGLQEIAGKARLPKQDQSVSEMKRDEALYLIDRSMGPVFEQMFVGGNILVP
jgi:serine/threonine protein kinase